MCCSAERKQEEDDEKEEVFLDSYDIYLLETLEFRYTMYQKYKLSLIHI